MADTLNLKAERAAFEAAYLVRLQDRYGRPLTTEEFAAELVRNSHDERRYLHAESFWQGWLMARRSSSSVSEAEMPELPIMANGRPVEHAQMDWVCRFISENSIFDGDEILQAWNALVAFYVARRASSVPAIPGTGREKEQAVAWALVSPKGGIKKVSITRQSVESRMARWLEEWPGNTPRIRPLVYGDADAVPSHPSEAKAGEDA